MVFKRNLKNKMLIGTMVLSLISVNPVYSFGEEKREVVDIPSGASFYHKKMIGKDRYETSNKILKEMGDKNETVILVNASEIMSDGLSASALAGKLKANIVPINPKKVNKNTMEKVKKAKTVYLIGGYNAIPKSFESNLKNKKVIRIGGKDRVETSEKIAKYIGSYKKAYIVNGYTGQADAMSISPVAARDVSPIILTKKSNSETPKKDNVDYTVIGGENAVSEKIRKRFSSQRIDGKDRYETNRNVLKKFYPNRKSISFCNGETLVDALSGTVYAKDEGIALVNRKNNLDLLEYISTSQLGGLPFDVNFVYGGSGGTGGSGGSGGGNGGGTVVPEENKLETPKLEANITGKYNIDETKGEVILDITNKDKYSQGTKFEYKEINGKEIPTDNYYKVGETYSIQVRAILNGKESELSNKVEFTVPKKVDEKYATLLSGGEIIENPDKPGEPLLNPFRGKIHEIVGSYDTKIKLKFEEKVPKEEFEKIKKEKECKALDINEKGEIIGYLEKDKDGNNVVHIISHKEIKANEDCSFMFTALNIKSIEGLEKIDTYNITNMTGMFSGCSIENGLDLSKFDTSKVTNMSEMFKGCNVKGNLDLSGLNTSNVTTMESMFEGYGTNEYDTINKELDLSNFDISSVTTMESMFEKSGIKSLKIGGLDKKEVKKNMSKMFEECMSLESLDLSKLDTSNATDMSNMFSKCYSLTSSDESNFNTSNFNTSNVTDMSNMFSGCSGLTSLDVSKFDTNKVTNMSNMFSGCRNITSLVLSNFNTSNVTDMSGMFSDCSNITSLVLSSFNTSNVTDMSYMFFYCKCLPSLDLSNFNTANVTNMKEMFGSCNALTTLNLSGWQPTSVTNMEYMFAGCRTLTTLNLSDWDTSNVTSMEGMFNECSALTTLNLSGWQPTSVTNMGYMFNECSVLTTLNLSGWQPTSVSNMEYMFNMCSALTTLDLSGWDTSNVIGNLNPDKGLGMEGMFNECSALTTLNLSGWDTSNVINMKKMFFGCTLLNEIYGIDGFDLSSVKNMESIFESCHQLKASIHITKKKDGTVYEDECVTKNAFMRGQASSVDSRIIVYYKPVDENSKENVKKFIKENLEKNNPSNDSFYNVEYVEDK